MTDRELMWMHKFIRDNIITHNPADINRHPERWTPLYTAPQPRQWQGLSTEEIYDMYNHPRSDAEIVEFARAVEAKIKEKNT